MSLARFCSVQHAGHETPPLHITSMLPSRGFIVHPRIFYRTSWYCVLQQEHADREIVTEAFKRHSGWFSKELHMNQGAVQSLASVNWGGSITP